MHAYITACCDLHSQHNRRRRVQVPAADRSMQDVKQLSTSRGRHPESPEKYVLQLTPGLMPIASSRGVDAFPIIPLPWTALSNAQRSSGAGVRSAVLASPCLPGPPSVRGCSASALYVCMYV